MALGSPVLEAQRVFCVGRNYAAHAAELDNPIPDSLVVFLKPPQCLVPAGARLAVPAHGNELHHEAEVVLLIAREGKPATLSEAWDYVLGVSLGLDLTLRDVQQRLTGRLAVGNGQELRGQRADRAVRANLGSAARRFPPPRYVPR